MVEKQSTSFRDTVLTLVGIAILLAKKTRFARCSFHWHRLICCCFAALNDFLDDWQKCSRFQPSSSRVSSVP